MHIPLLSCIYLTILYKLSKRGSTKKLWKKLEELYLPQSIPNKFFLKISLVSKLISQKNWVIIFIYIYFNKLIQHITKYCDNVFNEYKMIILLNAISSVYKEIKNIVNYGRKALTPDIVIDSLKSKGRKLKLKEPREKLERFTKRGIYFIFVEGKMVVARTKEEIDLNYRERQTVGNVMVVVNMDIP